jgi:hypothetical protein
VPDSLLCVVNVTVAEHGQNHECNHGTPQSLQQEQIELIFPPKFFGTFICGFCAHINLHACQFITSIHSDPTARLSTLPHYTPIHSTRLHAYPLGSHYTPIHSDHTTHLSTPSNYKPIHSDHTTHLSTLSHYTPIHSITLQAYPLCQTTRLSTLSHYTPIHSATLRAYPLGSHCRPGK